MGKLFIALFACVIVSYSVHAQTVGSYRSAQSGSWTDLSTWERWSGSAWVTPTPAQGTPATLVTIQNGHTVNISQGVTVIITNATGTDLTVSGGFLTVAGTLIFSNGVTANTSNTNTSFLSGGRYRHSYTGTEGSIPLASWDQNSTVEIAYVPPSNTSISFSSGGNWNQIFGNVEVNSTLGNNRVIDVNGFFQNVAGNLIVNSTGNGSFRINNNQTTSLTVGGSLIVNGNAAVTLNETGTLNLALAGLTVNGGNVSLANGNNSNTVVTISSQFHLAGGVVNMKGSNSASSTLNIAGDFLLAGGMVDRSTGGSVPAFNFSGTGQNFTITNGTFTSANNKPYSVAVNPSSSVTLEGTLSIFGSVVVNGTLNATNNSAIAGSCSFTLNNNATLGLASTHAGGALQPGNTVGSNLRNTGTRTFASGSSLMYNGVNLQFTGTGYPVSQGVNLIINNAANVRPSQDLTVTGGLVLQAGNLDFSDRTLILNGSFSATSGSLFANENSLLTISGEGSFGTLQFASGGNILNTLTIERADEEVILGSDITLTGIMNLNMGIFNAGAHAITMQGSEWNTNGATFLYGTSTVIFDGNTILTGNPPEFYSIALNAGATVDFPDGEVYITKDILLAPAATSFFNHNNGTVILFGGENQFVNGGDHTFYNLTVNKSGGTISLNGRVNLESILDIQSSSQFNSNGNLVLLSSGDDPDVSALINTLPSGAAVNGNVEVQRFMSGEGQLYRYISSPVENASVAQWKDDFHITGTFSDPSPSEVVCGVRIRSNSPSLFYYDEPTGFYMNYPASGLAANSAIEVGVGYAAYIRQCSTPTIIDVTGRVNQGNISLPVSFDNPAFDEEEQFDFSYNLVGNPYPAPIRWSPEGWNSNNVGAIVFIRDNGDGAFRYFHEDDGEVISMGQGFWVFATGDNPQLQVTEQAKSVNRGAFYRAGKIVPDRLTINLTDGEKTDRAYFRIKALAKDGLDRNDAPKLDNDYFEIATLTPNATPLAVNVVSDVTCGQVVPLWVNDLSKGTYTLGFTREGIFEAYDVSVVDEFSETTFRVREHETYSFDVTDAEASKASNRFRIILNSLSLATDLNLDKGTQALCGDNNYAVTINNVQPYVEYYATLNGQVISDKITREYSGDVTLSFAGSALASGANTIVLIAKNICGEEASLNAFQIQKENVVSVSASASSVICREGSATLTGEGAGAKGTYAWFNSLHDTSPVFIGDTFETPVINKTKTYYVAGINSLGCQGPKAEVNADVMRYEVPVIVKESPGILQSNYKEGNQWYYNDLPILNGTTQNISASRPGVYSVAVTLGQCAAMARFDYSQSFFDEMSGHEKLQVFPNPIVKHETVSFRVFAETTTGATLINATGKVMGRVELHKESSVSWLGTAAFDKLPAGVYYISVKTSEGVMQSKVIKQ